MGQGEAITPKKHQLNQKEMKNGKEDSLSRYGWYDR